MAQAISCDLCQQETAVMMQSNLVNGNTIGVGEACMVTFFASSLAAMLSGAPPEALNSWSAVLVPLAAIIGPSEAGMEDGIPPRSPEAPDDPHGYAAEPGEPGMFPPNPLPGAGQLDAAEAGQ